MSDTIERLRTDLDNVCAGYRSLKDKWELANSEISTLRSQLAEAQTALRHIADSGPYRSLEYVEEYARRSLSNTKPEE